MTEEEWMTPGDLRKHVELMQSKKLNRKLRLFGVACCWPLQPWMDNPVIQQALLRSELLADEELSNSTMQKWRLKLDRAEEQLWEKMGKCYNHAATPQRTVYYTVRWVCHESGFACYSDSWQTLVREREEFGEEFVRRGPAIAHATLLEIFGNPFRPVAFKEAWRTDTAVSLARTMYDSREFGAMPILADSLQDAGCDNEAILSHCRDATLTHVRGCWVVDLVLGRA